MGIRSTGWLIDFGHGVGLNDRQTISLSIPQGRFFLIVGSVVSSWEWRGGERGGFTRRGCCLLFGKGAWECEKGGEMNLSMKTWANMNLLWICESVRIFMRSKRKTDGKENSENPFKIITHIKADLYLYHLQLITAYQKTKHIKRNLISLKLLIFHSLFPLLGSKDEFYSATVNPAKPSSSVCLHSLWCRGKPPA